jgi:transcriptional regulator with XRE-family HTH domain
LGNTVSPASVSLGAAIRRYREAAGLTQAQFAKALNYSEGWVSNVETAQLHPKQQAIMMCEKVLGLPDGALLDIYQLIKHDKPHPVGSFERFADAERRALVIREYDALVVPGLLQTPEYARALIAAGRPTAKPEVVDNVLAARLERQEILSRDTPPTLWLVVDETVLRRPIGGREVHLGQLDALLAAAERPGIAVQVIPLATGAHAGLTCSFHIFSFSDGPDVAYTEDHETGYFRERPDLVRPWFDAYEALRVVTQPAAASLELIEQIREQL